MFDSTVVGYVIKSIGSMFISFVNFWFTIPVGDLPITFGEIVLMTIFFGIALRLLLGISFHGGGSSKSSKNNTTKTMKSDIEEKVEIEGQSTAQIFSYDSVVKDDKDD